ncbi:hypothetical protein ACRAWD_30645 [Caulobacter segnis]
MIMAQVENETGSYRNLSRLLGRRQRPVRLSPFRRRWPNALASAGRGARLSAPGGPSFQHLVCGWLRQRDRRGGQGRQAAADVCQRCIGGTVERSRSRRRLQRRSAARRARHLEGGGSAIDIEASTSTTRPAPTWSNTSTSMRERTTR